MKILIRKAWQIRLIVSIILLVLQPGFASAQSESSYAKALAAMKSNEWSEAAKLLENEHLNISGALKNYLLAICWSNQHDIKKTIVFSTNALSASPPLEEIYVPTAKALVNWGISNLNSQNVKVTFSMSVDDDESKKDLAKLSVMKQQADLEKSERENLGKLADKYADPICKVGASNIVGMASQAPLFDSSSAPPELCPFPEPLFPK